MNYAINVLNKKYENIVCDIHNQPHSPQQLRMLQGSAVELAKAISVLSGIEGTPLANVPTRAFRKARERRSLAHLARLVAAIEPIVVEIETAGSEADG